MTDRPEDPEDLSFATPGPGADPHARDGVDGTQRPSSAAGAHGARPTADVRPAGDGVAAPVDDPAVYGARWGAPGGPTPAERAEARRRARRWVAGTLGAIVLVVAVAAGVSSVTTRAHDDAWVPLAADVTEPTTANAVQLVLGSCVAEVPPDAEVGVVQVVPCTSEHSAQVVGRTDSAPDEVWPGDDVVAARAARICTPDLLGPRAAGAGDGVALVVWAPSEASWEAGDRTGLCVATTTAPATGSLLE
ncbi:septum formation family protein [Isoptericola aurantiacus]|uniref:septum formation family protein n=1 Tax=Isoptericola aurantiacus TaxID=3377839 RepID=UPI00383AA586